MNTPKPEHVAELEDGLRQSAERLLKLLVLKAPKVVIASEVALMMSKATLLYGELPWGALGTMLDGPVRLANFRCSGCLAPLPPCDLANEFCGACKARIDAAFDETTRN